MNKETKTPDLDAPVADIMAPQTASQDAPVAEPAPHAAPHNDASSFATAPAPQFSDFDAFYDYYVSEHTNANNRRLHVVGIGLALLCLINVVLNGVFGGFWSLIWAAIFAFGFAFAGDKWIEKKTPTLLSHPAWSLMADAKMAFEVVTQKRAW